MNDTLAKWADKGFYGFTDKAGRRWRADTYTRSVIKSTSYRVYRDMRERPAEELGIDTFYYSMKASARAMCSPLQHQIVTKGAAREEEGISILSLQDHGYGTPAGCLGINCGHYMTPFVVGVNDKPELPEHLKGITPNQAEENARVEAQQRAFEREIRKNKERRKVAREIGDKELIQKYKLKEITLNGQYKAHLDANKFLYRNLKRERYRKDPENYKNIYETLDKKLKKEYSEILQNLGDKAPKSYSDFKALDAVQKLDLRHSLRVVRYFKGDIKENLSEEQKKQAVEAYFNFKRDGILFGDHGVARYIERMRRKDGTFKYNYNSILGLIEERPLYNSTRDGKVRDVRYNDHLILLTERGTKEVVSVILRSSKRKGKDIPKKDWEVINYDSN